MSVDVPYARAEEARARMIELFPSGFEEIERDDGIELVAYTDASGEERLWEAFGATRGTEVQPGWEDGWRQFHRPTRVGALWVGPPWEEPPADAIPIVVDPGRAFGTGSHPTTQLCLELLQEVAQEDGSGSLLDIGCGSGVLSIGATRLGYEPVLAIDDEDAAVEATRENAARNGVSVDVRRRDAFSSPLPPVDVAVANITLAAAEAVAASVQAKRLLTSGYLESDRPSAPGWRHVGRRVRDGWAADRFERAD